MSAALKLHRPIEEKQADTRSCRFGSPYEIRCSSISARRKIVTSNQLAGANRQNRTGRIELFSTHFVLICTTNSNFVLLPFWKKERDAAR